jgi:drug/metabolite transporter (DMT)-like permease
MLIVEGVVFGAMVCMNRIAVAGGVPPLGYAFWQCFGAGIVLLLASLATGRQPGLGRTNIAFYLVVGGLGVAIPWSLLAVVAPHLPAGLVTLLLGLIPTTTYALALVVRVRSANLISVAGLLLGFSGLLLIVVPEKGLPEPGAGIWILILILSVFVSACSNVVAERYRPAEGSSSIALASGTLLAAAAVLLLLVIVSRQFYPIPTRLTLRDYALALSVVLAAVNVCLFFEVVRRAGAVFVSQFNYIVVPSGVVWGVILFHERLSLWIWLAIPLMLGGIALVNTGIKPAAASQLARLVASRSLP